MERPPGLRRLATALLLLSACGDSGRIPTSPPATPPPAPTPTPGALSCGVERWPVKTLTDADAARISLGPASTTIRALDQRPGHCNGGPNSSRPYPEELQVYTVIGRILLARLEDDDDYHLALLDPESGDTIVTEVAHPGCASPFSPGTLLLEQARAQFESFRAGRSLDSLRGQLVTVTGVGFYDFDHNQTGRSPNCIELHPVLSLRPGAG
jgi:hypothetical protein